MGYRFRREVGRNRKQDDMDEQIDEIQCAVARVAYPLAMGCLGVLLVTRAIVAAQSAWLWIDLAAIWLLSLLAFFVMMGRLFGWTPEVLRPALGGLAVSAAVGLVLGTWSRLLPDQAMVVALTLSPVGVLLGGYRLGWFGRLARDEGWRHAQGQALSAAIMLLLCLSGLALVFRYFIDKRQLDLARFFALFVPMVVVSVLFEVWGGSTSEMFRRFQSHWVIWGLALATVTVLTRGWEWPHFAVDFGVAYLGSRYFGYRRRLAERRLDQLEHKPPAGDGQ